MRENQNPAYPPSGPAAARLKWTKPVVLASLVAVTALLPLMIRSIYLLHILILTFIYIVPAASLRTITISGQFPLAHGAFMGIGAYLAGMASKWLGWSPYLAIPVAALATMGIGMLISYPFTRLRTLYYAMGSLFFGIGVIYIIKAGGTWTGGYSGFTGIRPMFGGSKLAYYYFFPRVGRGKPHCPLSIRVFPYRHELEGHRPVIPGGFQCRHQRNQLPGPGGGCGLFFLPV